MTGGDAVKSLVTKMPECPFCSEEFKNVRLHIVKKHEAIRIVCGSEDDDIPKVFYGGHIIELEFQADYDAPTTYLYTYMFPDFMTSALRYDGIVVTQSKTDNSILGCQYYVWCPDNDENGQWKSKGQIANHRITSSVARVA